MQRNSTGVPQSSCISVSTSICLGAGGPSFCAEGRCRYPTIIRLENRFTVSRTAEKGVLWCGFRNQWEEFRLSPLPSLNGMSQGPGRLRIFTLLEGKKTSGAIRPILQFAQEASTHPDSCLDITVGTYVRNGEDALGDAIQQLGLPFRRITERCPWDWRILSQLRVAIADCKPTIIWTHNCKSHFLVRLLGLHRRAKWVATHHGYTREAFRTLFYNQLDRWSLRGAARICADCRAHTKQLSGRLTRTQHVVVQHNPIRSQAFSSHRPGQDLRARLGVAQDVRIILTVGRLSSEKGHADLIKAICLRNDQNPPVVLVVVGDGPERQNLINLCSAMKINRVVRFLGFQDDVYQYYLGADLFVLPSHSEGSPNVLLEALDAGVPVVATAVGGVPEIVEDGVSAVLVELKKPRALAFAIDLVLANDELRRRLVAEGHQVVAKHTPQEYFQRMSALFQDVSAE